MGRTLYGGLVVTREPIPGARERWSSSAPRLQLSERQTGDWAARTATEHSSHPPGSKRAAAPFCWPGSMSNRDLGPGSIRSGRPIERGLAGRFRGRSTRIPVHRTVHPGVHPGRGLDVCTSGCTSGCTAGPRFPIGNCRRFGPVGRQRRHLGQARPGPSDRGRARGRRPGRARPRPRRPSDRFGRSDERARRTREVGGG